MITIKQALEKILFVKRKAHKQANQESNTFKVWRHRYRKGTMSLDQQEEILKKYGWVKKKDSMWGRNC